MFEIDVCYKFIFESMLEDDVLGYIANKVYEYTHAGIFFVSESGEILLMPVREKTRACVRL